MSNLVSFSVTQEEKLTRELKLMCRNAKNDIKLKIDSARSSVKNNRIDKKIPSFKGILGKYNSDIISINSMGEESINIIENHLSKRKEYIKRREQMSKENQSKKNVDEFNEFIEELLRNVDKFSKNKKQI